MSPPLPLLLMVWTRKVLARGMSLFLTWEVVLLMYPFLQLKMEFLKSNPLPEILTWVVKISIIVWSTISFKNSNVNTRRTLPQTNVLYVV
uniref:Putative product n=1 Tax=Xenopsylla cheopis TaxID=163159 RepID=A0A6M2DY67_XENCH